MVIIPASVYNKPIFHIQKVQRAAFVASIFPPPDLRLDEGSSVTRQPACGRRQRKYATLLNTFNPTFSRTLHVLADSCMAATTDNIAWFFLIIVHALPDTDLPTLRRRTRRHTDTRPYTHQADATRESSRPSLRRAACPHP